MEIEWKAEIQAREEGRDDKIERHSCSRITRQRTRCEGLRQEGIQCPRRVFWASVTLGRKGSTVWGPEHKGPTGQQGLVIQTRSSGEAESSEEVTQK